MLRPILAGLALVLALAAPALAAGVPDAASLQKSRAAAGKRMTDAAGRAKALTDQIRKAVGDPADRVARDSEEIDAKAGNAEYETAIGILGISLDYVPNLPEEKREPVKAALLKLRAELEAAAIAQRADEGLRELEERLPPLKDQVANGDDLVSPLDVLDDSVGKAELAQGLTKPEVAALRGHLADVRAAFAARIAREMLDKATADFAELDQALPGLQAAFEGADAGARDSAHATYSDTTGRIRYSLARIPESDAAANKLRERLAKLDAERSASYAKHYGETVAGTLRENFEFSAHEFEGWEAEEATPPTASQYVNLEGSNLELMYHPRKAAYVNRSSIWLAFVEQQEDYRLAAGSPKVKELLETVRTARARSLDRLVKAADALVADMAKTPIEDERARNRYMVLADWELHVLLQNDPRQWPLIGRLHEVVDAYDRKALGGEKALALTRKGALEAAEATWARTVQRIPAGSGFDPLHSALFKGRMMRLEKVHDFGASFKAADHDAVLSLDGNLFTARYDPALKAAIASALARNKTTLGPVDDLELVVIVGDEGTVALDASPARSFACRKLAVVGMRAGPVAFMKR